MADLDELFTIVGADSTCARVVKLFNGFRPSIRKALLREHMNPEYTSWKDMVRKAKYQEMAENVDIQESNSNGWQSHQSRHNGQTQGNQVDNPKQNTATDGQHKSKNSKSFGGRKTHNTNGNQAGSKGCGGHTSQQGKGGSHNSSHKKADYQQTNPLSKEQKSALRNANKCFLCEQEGHFACNCPIKGRAKSSNGKPPGVSTFGISIDLEQTEQFRQDSVGKITELSAGMIGRVIHLEIQPKKYDSDKDTIPDLQSMSVSDQEDGMDLSSLDSYDSIEDPYVDNREILFSPPIDFEYTYDFPVESGEDKICLLDVESEFNHLGDAACNKLEELLESMQPYPGDPVNVLQFHGKQFVETPISHNELLIRDRVFDLFNMIPHSVVMWKDFPVGHWYTTIRHSTTRAPYNWKSVYQTLLIVDPYA